MAKPIAEEFLARGLFPENIPSAFSGTSLQALYAPHAANYLVTKASMGRPVKYSASKRAGQRRSFSIPHPTFAHDAATFFSKHWAFLDNILKSSTISRSYPEVLNGESRCVRITPHKDLPKHRLKALGQFRFCASTDISRFFPSIYTHIIPWALHGRLAAKGERDYRSSSIFGNRLDFITRQSQDGQTIGIPVGPDISKITSELILCAVDAQWKLIDKAAIKTTIRHVDDYWIGGNSIEECESRLQTLRRSLGEFELELNDLKTKVVPVSSILAESWPSDIEEKLKTSLRRSRFQPQNDSDAVAALSGALALAANTSDGGIIKHVIRVIDANKLWDMNWELLEPFIAQCAVQSPHSFDYVARVVAWRNRRDQSIDSKLWKRIAIQEAGRAANLGHDSETLWALWLMRELNGLVPIQLSDHIINNCGPVVLAYLAHMNANSLTRAKNLRDSLWATITDDPYAGASWLLALELTHLGIHGPAGALAGSGDPLQFLIRSRASLVDWDAPPRVFAAAASEGRGVPLEALEDIGSDYSSDDADLAWLGDDDDRDFAF